MRAKFILFKFIPVAITFALLVFLINNNLNIELRLSIGDSKTNEGNDLFTHAYRINLTRLYESISLTTANLDLSGYLCNQNKKSTNATLIGLMTRADAFDRRNLIRQTLGKQIEDQQNHLILKRNLKQNFPFSGKQVNATNQALLFFIAKSPNEKVNEQVDEEFVAYQDLVRLEYIEDYYNLTLKSIAFLEYFNRYCNGFKYAIKLDDDILPNWYTMQQFLMKQPDDEPSIYCKVHKRPPVIRDISNKWAIRREDYSANYYPDYCAGPIYALNRKAAEIVIDQHRKIKQSILVFEDVYCTGICTQHTKIKLVSAIKLLNPNKYDSKYFLKNYFSTQILAIHPMNHSNYEKVYFEAERLPKPVSL